jgi:hypothetical protein
MTNSPNYCNQCKTKYEKYHCNKCHTDYKKVHSETTCKRKENYKKWENERQEKSICL